MSEDQAALGLASEQLRGLDDVVDDVRLHMGMATDGCHEGDTEWVCELSTEGQNLLVFSPVLWLAGGVSAAIVVASIAACLRRTPLIGIGAGIVAYIAMVPLSNLLVERV